MPKKIDPLKPSTTLLIKLGSAFVHAEELIEENREAIMGVSEAAAFDVPAFETVAQDAEVVAWVKAMGPFLPRKRSSR